MNFFFHVRTNRSAWFSAYTEVRLIDRRFQSVQSISVSYIRTLQSQSRFFEQFLPMMSLSMKSALCFDVRYFMYNNVTTL